MNESLREFLKRNNPTMTDVDLDKAESLVDETVEKLMRQPAMKVPDEILAEAMDE